MALGMLSAMTGCMNAIEVSPHDEPATMARLNPSGRKLSKSALALRLEMRESVEDLKEIGAMVKNSLTLGHFARQSPWAFALTFFAIGLYIGSDD